MQLYDLGFVNGYRVYRVLKYEWYINEDDYVIYHDGSWVYTAKNLQDMVNFVDEVFEFDTKGCSGPLEYAAHMVNESKLMLPEMVAYLVAEIKAEKLSVNKIDDIKNAFYNKYSFDINESIIKDFIINYTALGHH